MTTNFILKPYKNFIIKEIIKLSKEDFAKYFINNEAKVMEWANGVMLFFEVFENVINSNKDLDKDTYCFDKVYYSEYPDKPQFLEHNGIKIEVIDTSNVKRFREFTEWLKRQGFWK